MLTMLRMGSATVVFVDSRSVGDSVIENIDRGHRHAEFHLQPLQPRASCTHMAEAYRSFSFF
jgi:hypothetical protein